MRVRIVVFIILCCWLNSAAVVGAVESQEKYRVVFSTFDINSAGKYSYLRDGIQNMLAGRLAARDRIDVLDHSLSASELQLLKKKDSGGDSVAEEIKADYLVTGGLFSLTSGFNLQVTLYPLATGKDVLNFSIMTENIDTVIPEVEKLAQDIAETAFGYESYVPQTADRKIAKRGDSGFVTVHPEAAYKKGLYTGTVVGVAGGMIKTSAVGVKRRTTIDGEIRAMAVGDIDGNGEEEIIVLVGRELMLYSVQGRKIVQVAKTSLAVDILAHAVNIADIDGNGIKEIYISATRELRVDSIIMTWSVDSGFQTIGQYIPWYIRPVLVPGKGWVLAGQKRGNEKIKLVRPGIYQLSFDANMNIEQGEQLPLPRSVNLFDFIYADINGDGSFEIAVIDSLEKMKIYSQQNELMWVSSKNYCGSKVYLGPSQGSATDERSKTNFTADENSDRELIFVPGRIVVTDMNGDGNQEVIVSEHEMSSFSFFNRLRPYQGGNVVGLTWNGAGLSELWRTGRYSGHVAGHEFSIFGGAVNDDGKKSTAILYVGSIPTSGSVMALLPGGTKSELTVYELGFESIKTE